MLFLSVGPGPHHPESPVGASVQAVADGALLITEFYPAALSQDEYVVISSASSSATSLLGYGVTDGEGTMLFVSDVLLSPGRSLSISMNSSSFIEAYGRTPSLSLPQAKENGTLALSGSFRLGDSGDALALVAPGGDIVDCVKYGASTEAFAPWAGDPVPTLKQGEVCRRIGSGSIWRDTDCASDWFPFREFKYGYTEFEPLDADVGASDLTAFVSPDCSLEVVLEIIRSAERSIRLCSYELSSSAVCEALMDAVARGVRVKVLVDGAPAGGMDDRQVICLSVLSEAGADVSAVNGNLSRRIVQHLGPLHSKYMVVDSERSVVLSENFVESGLPVDRLNGNRGWGVSIHSPEVSAYLSRLFDSDARPSRPDVAPWPTDARFLRGAELPPRPIAEHSEGPLRPFVSASGAHVTVVPSPDGSATAPFLQPVLRRACSMDVEQFQVDLLWENRWTKKASVNPLLDAMAAAMREGTEVRMIFDSSWFNVEGNRPAMDYMGAIASADSRESGFRSICNGSPVSVVHNKGAIIDGSTVLVSSNNWGVSSFARNRELAVLIASSEVSAYFRRAFDMDWEPDSTAPVAEAGDDLEVRVGRQAVLNGSLSSDDRVVANYSWDLDGDGIAELYGKSVGFVPRREGTYRITLTVVDPWGNEGSDEIVLTAKGRAGGSGVAPPSLPWFALLSGVWGVLLGGLAARARRPRKINHPPPPDQ